MAHTLTNTRAPFPCQNKSKYVNYFRLMPTCCYVDRVQISYHELIYYYPEMTSYRKQTVYFYINNLICLLKNNDQ